MDVPTHWPWLRSLFREAFASSLHFSLASVNADGSPHVTPIGSVLLGEPGQGLFFEVFARELPRNLGRDTRMCILAVNSHWWWWIRALWAGRFPSPPAVRLVVRVADTTRPATAEETARFARRVRHLRRLRGHALLWGQLERVRVRDFTVERVEPVHLGAMTRGLVAEVTGGETRVDGL